MVRERGSARPDELGHALTWHGPRLRAPALPRHYVRRNRLLGLLDELSRSPVVLIVAPAGSGKSSLLTDWSARCQSPTAWLTLDETDRDASQLWAELAEVLSTIAPQVAGLARPRRQRIEDGLGALLTQLEEDHPPRAVLVLDDLHVLDDDEEGAAALRLLLEWLPPWLHVVLLSRRVPPLPIDRLRARGQLGEVHFDELRFSTSEAVEVLARIAPELDPEHARRAAAAADGWVADLQLTALAARSEVARTQGSPPVSSSSVLVSDYVWNEVLGSERPDVVQVLMDTSVVTRTNAVLAAVLTGRDDAGDLLAEAERRGLFVTRLGISGWFEIHPKVREILLRRATSESPGHVADLHARAGGWLEEAGEIVPAIHHWQQAGRPRRALRVLARNVTALYDEGRAETIVNAVEEISPSIATSSVHATIERAWCLFLVDRRGFARAVDQAAYLASLPDTSERVQGRVMMLRAISALMSGDWSQAASQARNARDVMGDGYWQDLLGRFVYNLLGRELALSEAWDSSAEDVRACELGVAREPERQLAFEGTRAVGEVLSGHPLDALRTAAGLRGATHVVNLSLLRTELSLAEALAHREVGDGPRAMTELLALRSSLAVPLTYAHLYTLLELTEIHLDNRDLEAAQETFDDARRFTAAEMSGRGAHDRLARTGSSLALAVGDTATALRWSSGIHDDFWGPATRARVILADGMMAEARESLRRAVPRCLRHRVVHELLAARSTPDRDRTRTPEVLEEAFDAGLLQTVATEGAQTPQLMEIVASVAKPEWMDRLRRATAAPVGSADALPWPAEPLTRRELEVLRLLPGRLTLSEIAEQLDVSVNTVKYHVRLIYQKLGVRSRSAAAQAARRMTRTGPRPGQTTGSE